jgi:hypothetical protein
VVVVEQVELELQIVLQDLLLHLLVVEVAEDKLELQEHLVHQVAVEPVVELPLIRLVILQELEQMGQ